MSKRIGILGGISCESTLAYYQLIHTKYYELKGDYYYPEIIIYSLNFQKFTDFEVRGEKQAYIEYILTGLRALERAGAEFGLLAANSPHVVFSELEKEIDLPLLSIVDVTAKHAKVIGVQRLLLLGIRFTMESHFFQKRCSELGINVIIPVRAEREEIDRIIFEELVIGIIKESSRQRLLDIINEYEVDGVILGCTELPLILHKGDSKLPFLNTLELHAGAALNYALDIS